MKHTELLRLGVTAAAAAAVLWLGTVFLLPALLPFLLALLAARAVRKPAAFLEERCRLPRALASGAALTVLLALVIVLLWALGRLIWSELGRFAGAVPEMLTSLAGPMGRLRQWLLNLSDRLPEALQDPVRQNVENFFENGSVVAERAASALFSLASGTVSRLPDFFLFLVTTVLASFLACSRYEAICAFLRRQIPVTWRNRYQAILACLRSTLAVWLKAQLKLIGINFLVLSAGLWILGVDFPLLFGGLIALIDALPLFGAGTVLIPWSILSFLRGDTSLGVGLALLYATAYVIRSVLEPRLIGRQVGLPPLVTLLAIYAGYRYAGVAGMILFPVGTMLFKQFWDHTVPKQAFNTRKPERNTDFPQKSS